MAVLLDYLVAIVIFSPVCLYSLYFLFCYKANLVLIFYILLYYFVLWVVKDLDILFHFNNLDWRC